MAYKKQQKRSTKKQTVIMKVGYNASDIDYKNTDFLKQFLSSRYKILPRKLTGLNAKNQRKLKTEIKKARIMGLLPYTDRHSLI